VGVLKTLGATLAGILCDDGEPALAPIKELRRA
jgi:hypothetical protein